MNLNTDNNKLVGAPSWTFPCPAILAEIKLMGHVRIEASAGTGKTYTLEHLVVDRLVRTQAQLSEILVMTFTEKATAELKQRIRRLLTQVILKSKQVDTAPNFESNGLARLDNGELCWCFDQNVRRKLELTLFAFDDAPIFTIHGFCNRILREQAFLLSEPLLQERVDTKVLFRMVWRSFLSSQSAQAEREQALLKAWLSVKSEPSLFELLYEAFSEKYSSRGFKVRTQLRDLLATLKNPTTQEAIADEIKDAAITSTARSEFVIELNSMARLLNEVADTDVLTRLTEIDWKRLVSPRGTRVGAKTFKFPDGLSSTSRTWHYAASNVCTILDLVSSIEYQVLEYLLPQLESATLSQKRRNFLFDYDDLLHRLHHVLVKNPNPELKMTLGEEYAFALIDEFQDTDEIQWQIIEAIFLNQNKSQLILIGDPKQSIYGFRGAEVETYLNAGRRLEVLTGQKPKDVFLDTNYRSSACLIDGLNLILDQRATSPIFSGTTQYTTPVKCGKPGLSIIDAQNEAVPAISLLPFTPPSSGKKLSALVLMDHFTQRVSEEIVHLLSEQPFQIRSKLDGLARAIEPSDILILTRKNGEARDIERVLRQANLPVAQAPSGSVFKSKEAQALIDLLRAIASPAQVAAWTRTLNGPFFGLSWEKIDALEQVRPVNLQLHLEKWRELAAKGLLEQVLYEVYASTNLELRTALNDQDDQTMLNLRAVLNSATVETQRKKLSLSQLIDWLESIMSDVESAPEPYADAPPSPENSNSIRIMTMHASKGLESPIVFMCGGFSRLRAPLTIRSEVFGEKQTFLSAHAPVQVKEDAEHTEREEDEKLLYVGLTRASVKLYLPTVDSQSQIKGMYDLLNRRLTELKNEGALKASVFVEEPKRRVEAVRWQPKFSALPMPSSEEVTDFIQFEPVVTPSSTTPITSYSGLKRHRQDRGHLFRETPAFLAAEQTQPTALDPETVLQEEPANESETSELLPGGRHVGQALHDCLEHIDGPTWQNCPLSAFLESEKNLEICRDAVAKHQLEPTLTPKILTIVWSVLNAKLPLDPHTTLPPLGSLQILKEMEFLYPAPFNQAHPEGYIRGFIDGLFQFEGLYYWLDWKSDRVPDYSLGALKEHVTEHYGIQAQLYTLALKRLLRIESAEDYDRRVGGLLYVYLRGIENLNTPQKQGFHFARPSYDQLIKYEKSWASRGLYDPPVSHSFGQGGPQS